jgi:hypothetical protein
MTIEEMISAHPSVSSGERETLARCIEDCFTCAATCTACADACLGEDSVAELVPCIRLNLDCAEVCWAMGRLLARQTAFDPQLARVMLEACTIACRNCGEECERHAGHHDHCRVCAEACRHCEQSCTDLLAALG